MTDFEKFIWERTRYVIVSFFGDRVETSYGNSSDVKQWIERANHGYILDMRKDHTSYLFLLPWKKGEHTGSHISRAIRRAISFYKDYEKKDPFIEPLFS